MVLEHEAEHSPEQIVVIKQLLLMYRNGIQEQGLIGYHGLGIQTIDYVIHHGHVPGTTNPDDVTPPGSLFFAAITDDPYKKLMESDQSRQEFFEHEIDAPIYHPPPEGLLKAKVFARKNARWRGLLNSLGLDPTVQENLDIPFYFFGKVPNFPSNKEKARRVLRLHGITPRQLLLSLRQVKNSEGIVLGVGKNIVEDFPVILGQSAQDYAAIHEEGFRLDYFTGLQCLGPDEEKFFQDLDRRYGYLLE